ncbi:MAG: RluA family pseudouridine synthase [Myxococcaceae bacterium]
MPASPAIRRTVPPEARGQRLDQFLAATALGLTRSRLKGLIDQGLVTVDGAKAKSARRLKGGEELLVTVPPPEPATPRAQDLPLTVLYEDRDLVVLDKAAGMVVHPAPGNREGTLVNALLFKVKDLTGVGGELRPGLVHRLDKDTSGCVVVAKGEATLGALQAAFKARSVDKVYLALVHGSPPAKGTFRTLHGRHPTHRKRFSAKVTRGKLAVTHYRVLERFEGASLVEVTLETGRTHQIRVHFADAGFPLLGDALYGGARRGSQKVRLAMAALGRQALHAARLGFAHPRTGKRLELEAKLPDDFEAALAVLRG